MSSSEVYEDPQGLPLQLLADWRGAWEFAEAMFAKTWSAYKTWSKPIIYEIHA